MSDLVAETAASDPDVPVLKRLSTLDRCLPVWIIAAMGIGIGLGRAIPPMTGDLDTVQVGSVSLPMLLNWILGPALMFTLAWLLLPCLPACLPHRADHRRAGPLHRDGADLERTGLW